MVICALGSPRRDGNLIPGMVFENDDPGHPSSMWADFVVPAGQSYTMTGSWGPMPDGPDSDSSSYFVTPARSRARRDRHVVVVLGLRRA